MNEFCEGVLEYIKNENEFEKIIALTLRDIYLNELIYIAYTDKWMKYNISEKKWSSFNPGEFLGKLQNIKKFYYSNLKSFVTKPNYSRIEQFYIHKEIIHLCNYIDKYFDKDIFLKECRKYFSVLSS